ncbi:SusC/RagA family TonB-linked outer membrane protein [Parapedobacter sp. DT-150]|uniref:SusC/RagA family TonB-linked outer membrane protein n=1 Tax=Parapedobacter sp. DT-150 TaxID=3396162 RepID=UPI003F1D280F
MKKIYGFPLLLLLVANGAFASANPLLGATNSLLVHADRAMQQVTVRGTVKNSQGVPLEGVSVQVKDTDSGTATDAEGRFVFDGIASDAILVFSSMGYKLLEIEVAGRAALDVVMEDDMAGLDEVIVVGYGVAKKSDLTGSVHRVNAADFQDQSTTQLTDMLAGTVAGFQANQGTTAAGGSSMEIRGVNSINASTSPMVVLDGVIYNGSINDINPNDIESIDILKDASSAAVYGARAANGVILVTTKRGASGKPTISVSTKQGTTNATSTAYAARGATNYLDYRRDFLRTVGGSQPDYYFHNPQALPPGVSIEDWRSASNNPNPDDTQEWLSRLNFFPLEAANYMEGHVVDWVDEVMQTGHRQEYDVSIGGGTDNAKYFWSLGYLDNEGIIVGDQYATVRSRLNLDMKVTDWLNVGMNAQYAYRDQSAVPASLGNLSLVSPFSSVYEEDGTINFYPHGYITQNPLINTLGQDRDYTIQSLFASLYGEVKLPFGITYRISFQPRSTLTKDYNFWSTETITGRETYSNGYGTRADNSSFEWMVDNLLKWNRTFGVHGFDVTLLYNAEHFRSWGSEIGNQSFQPSPTLGFGGLQFGNNPFLNTNDVKYTGDGFMARINYSLMDKYLITGSIRRDGFSGFGRENPYAVFPAAAVAWQVHREGFFHADFVNQLKLRVSWGKNGNRDIGPYASFAQMESVQYYDGTNARVGVYTSSLSNAALSWEETESLNFGADLTMFNNRLNLTVDYYDAKTNRLLVERSLPTITGFSSVTTNIGSLANKGFEVTLSNLNIKKPNFSWTSSLNFSLNRNRITSLFGETGTYVLEGRTHTGEIPDFSNQWFIGKSLDVVWDYHIQGVWQQEEAEAAAQYNLRPGDYKVEDLNGNLVYEALQDKQFIGYTVPRYTIGLRNEFNFLKNFTASVFVRADVGHIRAFAPLVTDFSTYDRRSTANFPYWTPENRSNEYPRLSRNTTVFGGNILPYKTTSFLRVQDVTLSYALTPALMERIQVGNARLFLSARNLLTVSDWPGWDPESGHNPMPKVYTIGLNFSL